MAVCCFGVATGQPKDDPEDMARRLRLLEEQNATLRELLKNQDTEIQRLKQRLSELEHRPATTVTGPGEDDGRDDGGLLGGGSGSPAIRLSGEAGLAFFHQGSEGQFPNAEFRVDEARLFLDAKVFTDVYLFGELNLIVREQDEEYLQLGELYVDFESLSKLWGQEGVLNARVGRMDIPFGEEYLTRDAIDNPLISHSLSDFWGIDEGIELYGRWQPVQYVVAVQNGGHPMLNDGDPDKSVAVKVGVDPARWVHLSVSAMRTGDLDVQRDRFSELWFANGFIRQMGSFDTTTFRAGLVQGDVQFFWRSGHVKGAGGGLHYDDNGSADTHRDVYHYHVEVLQQITAKLYAVARWSQILAEGGFPLVGAGDFGNRLFGNLTEELRRLSVGLGYRVSPNLVFKGEYSWNRGEELGGAPRNHEDLVAAEVAVRF
jgi:hypothetical protein